jgi:hypothetical protein
MLYTGSAVGVRSGLGGTGAKSTFVPRAGTTQKCYGSVTLQQRASSK